MSILKRTAIAIALFGTIGVGLGLSGYISLSYLNQSFIESVEGEVMRGVGYMLVMMVALQSSFVFFLLGSVVATVSANGIASEADSLKIAAASNGVASFVGFYLMVGIAVGIMLLALSGAAGPEGGGPDSDQLVQISDVVKPVLKIGVPTAVVGAVSGGLLFENADSETLG